MEDRHILNTWFERYTREMKNQPKDAMRAESWGDLWTLCFHDKIGNYDPEALDDAILSDLWEDAETKLHGRGELYSAFLLLRSLLSYISFVTGLTFCDVILPRSFIGREKTLTEEGCRLLDEIMLTYSGRIGMCFWLALHTSLTFSQIHRLPKAGFALENNLLTVVYSSHDTADDAQKPVARSVNIPLDERARDMVTHFLEGMEDDGSDLAFDPEHDESLEKLTSALAHFCAFCGLPELTLADIENAPTLICQPEDAFWSANSEHLRALAARLDPLMAKLPKPVLEHARRTRLLASFFTEQFRYDEWFINLGFDEYDMLFAVYYHDIGKTALKKDDYYATPRAQNDQNRLYRSHVAEGETVLTSAIGVLPENAEEESVEALLYAAAREHHERLDGKGFPKRKEGDEISFVGRLCALADTLDHKLFLDEPDADTDVVLLALDEDRAAYDGRLLDVLVKNSELFHNFVEELRDRDRKKRGIDSFGIRYTFYPYVHPETKEPVAFDTHLYFNDRYYGMIDSATILPLMEEHPQFDTFTKLQIRRLLRLMFTANLHDKNLPPLFLHVSLSPTQRETFFSELLQSFIRFNTRYHKVVFAFDESELIDTDTDVAALCDQFHLVGAGFAISGFGGKSTLLPQLNRIHPDYILMHPEYSLVSLPERMDFVRTTLATAQKTNIQVFLPAVDGHGAAETYLPFGFSGFGGRYAGEELTEKAFTKE